MDMNGDQEGIAAMPVTTAMPAMPASKRLTRLTPEQRRFYQDHGFVVVPDVFPSEELEAIDRECDRLIVDGQGDTGHRVGWIMHIAEKSDLAAKVAEDERLLSLVEEVVYPGVVIHSSKLVTKLPHNPEVCHWHQDEAFYFNPSNPDTASRRRMSVWVPLQEAHERNGCLLVVPGSHTWGIDDYTMVDYGTCRKKIDREAYANEHAIPVPVHAGSVVLFSAWTWHHSKGNETDRVRRAFIVSYQEATVPRGAGQQWKILRRS